MKRIITVLALFFFVITGCSNGEQEAKESSSSNQQIATASTHAAPVSPFRSVTVTEAKKILDTRKDIILLDVRTPEELREGAIEGSNLVPFWAVMQNKLNIPKETPIMLVCAVGGRSYAAGQMMVKFGYKEVYNVSGGLDAWKKARLPVKY